MENRCPLLSWTLSSDRVDHGGTLSLKVVTWAAQPLKVLKAADPRDALKTSKALCEHQTYPQSLWAMRSASESVGSASLHTRYVLDTHVVVVLALGVSRMHRTDRARGDFCSKSSKAQK